MFSYDKILRIIIKSLDEGYYCYIFSNEYFVPGKFHFNKYDQTYDNLIIGYDLVKQMPT